MNREAEIKKIVSDLCHMQKNHICDFPSRENIPVYDWQLDLEMNIDFALWIMEMYQ